MTIRYFEGFIRFTGLLRGELVATARRLHREDIKAELRKRFGSVAAFEARNGLSRDAVSDLLRGRSSMPTAEAVAGALGIEVAKLRNIDIAGPDSSGKPDDNPDAPDGHRLNAGRA